MNVEGLHPAALSGALASLSTVSDASPALSAATTSG
jgi:hypothetical protein